MIIILSFDGQSSTKRPKKVNFAGTNLRPARPHIPLYLQKASERSRFLSVQVVGVPAAGGQPILQQYKCQGNWEPFSVLHTTPLHRSSSSNFYRLLPERKN